MTATVGSGKKAKTCTLAKYAVREGVKLKIKDSQVVTTVIVLLYTSSCKSYLIQACYVEILAAISCDVSIVCLIAQHRVTDAVM
jgi:hypothetical protein